jgi:outer membrane protein OmpA-like peptidoglycan-associated protein
LRNFSFGATLQNLTISKIKFIDTEFLLPETVRGGLAARLPITIARRKFKVNVGTDVAKLLGSPEDKVRVYSGAEVRVSEVFALRGGYKFHDTELSRWGAGFGVIVPMAWLGRANAEVDYAYSPMDAFESQAHRFSLSFNFGAIKQVPLDTLRIAEMQQQVTQELEAATEAREAAERARTSAEEARLAAEETEKRLKDLEAAWQAKLDSIRQIAASAPPGAIEIAEQPGHNILMTLRINFDFDKAIIRTGDYETMFKVVDILQTTPNAKVGLTGHTDNIGTDEYNMKLSEARMNNVTAFLVRHGIDTTRFFMPVPYGEWKPLTENRTAEEQFRNRRVEFLLYTGGAPLIPEGSKIENVQVAGDSAIAIVGNGRLSYITSFVGNPPRLILKFPKVYTPDARTFPIKQGNFIQARMAYHPDERSTWVVFDLNAPPAQQPTWLVQDNRLILPLRNGARLEPLPATERRPNER